MPASPEHLQALQALGPLLGTRQGLERFERLLRGEQMRRSFALFVRNSWHVVDPAPLVWNEHIEAICEHLQALAAHLLPEKAKRYGWAILALRNLLINIPPGHAKSMIVGVLFPAWLWTLDPKLRIMGASYIGTLALRDAVKSRNVIESPWYREHFEPTWEMSEDQNAKGYFRNTALGERFSTSVGTGTGFRADLQIVDDPLSADGAESEVEREAAIEWFTKTMSSRYNNHATFCRVVIMQRLHDRDLSGYLLKESPDDWEHVCLPSRFEPDRKFKTSIGEDWRTEEGELLFPELFPDAVLAQAERSGVGMGPIAFAGQHQQRPMPASGGIVKLAWTRYRWHLPGADVRAVPPGSTLRPLDPRTAKWDDLLLTVDAAFKDTRKSDLVCILVAGRVGPDKFVIDARWERLGFNDTVMAIRDMIAKWPKVRRKIIEDKANGTAAIETLKTKFSGVVAEDPEGGKESRLRATEGEWAAGNVWLPLDAPWVADAVSELTAFPRGAHDDFVDACTYAVRAMMGSSDLDRFLKLTRKG